MATELEREIKKYVPKEVALVVGLMMAEILLKVYRNFDKELKLPTAKRKKQKKVAK
jgi:hypothetical protein